MQHAVEVVGLTKEFTRRKGRKRTRVRALDAVSFTLARGECVAVLGQNGSGKSTLVRALSTLLIYDGGSARVFGHDVAREERAVRRLVNRVSVEASFFKRLSATENLSYAARFYGLGRAQTKRQIPEILARSASRSSAPRADGGPVARDAAEGRARPRAADLADAAAARRADDRPRPALQARGPGVHRRGPPHARHDDAAVHARHGRGGGARRPRRDPAPGPPARARGARARCAAATARRRSRTRSSRRLAARSRTKETTTRRPPDARDAARSATRPSP